MALTTPILYSIPAFDAQNSFIFQFASIGGSQVVANTLTIKDNATLTTINDTVVAVEEYFQVRYSPAYVVSTEQPAHQESTDF